MKYLMILTVGVCLLIGTVPVMADQAADEAAIREASDKIMAAFSAHDMEGQLAFYDEKIEAWDGTAKGRVGHGKMIEEYLENQPKLVEIIGVIRLFKKVCYASAL